MVYLIDESILWITKHALQSNRPVHLEWFSCFETNCLMIDAHRISWVCLVEMGKKKELVTRDRSWAMRAITIAPD